MIAEPCGVEALIVYVTLEHQYVAMGTHCSVRLVRYRLRARCAWSNYLPTAAFPSSRPGEFDRASFHRIPFIHRFPLLAN